MNLLLVITDQNHIVKPDFPFLQIALVAFSRHMLWWLPWSLVVIEACFSVY